MVNVTRMFADAINFPIVLGLGMAVLIPLLAFEVLTESFVLGRFWNLSWADLRGFVLRANIWSLVAGIPTKLVNSMLYTSLLPRDLPAYFDRYPFAIACGTAVYFAVTVVVESLCAARWITEHGLKISRGHLWGAVLIANLATYVVVAPLHYHLTRPIQHITQFSSDTRWYTATADKVLFVQAATGHLKVVNPDGSSEQVIVPHLVRDYLVSSNLDFCLYRGGDNHLHFYNRKKDVERIVWKTKEAFFFDQVAFSPSGERIAVVSKEQKSLEIVNLLNDTRMHKDLVMTNSLQFAGVAWSTDESKLYLSFTRTITEVTVTSNRLSFHSTARTNASDVLPTFGRLPEHGQWRTSEDWGASFDSDHCGEKSARVEHGLGSGLVIFRQAAANPAGPFYLRVNPGLLHISSVGFKDVAFLGDCEACMVAANGYLYIVDLSAKRLGTLAQGDRFSLLTERYLKGL